MREGGSRDALEQLADSIAEVLRPGTNAASIKSEDFLPSSGLVRAKNSAA
jgi:hypothetical protein